MACPPIITGDQFLVRVLAHVDCQAQVIGSYGYQALGQPGSLASTVVAGLLTLFIAFFAIRLLFGPSPGARDVVFDVLKIGIVLTLAFSWPAFRTVVYDVTLKGPAEIAGLIQQGSGAASASSLPERLQSVDNSLAELTELGMGRRTGALIDEDAPGGNFQSAALQDSSALGNARLAYLASVIGSLGLLRIGAGLLLALTPVVAGLYFFTQSRGIFAGWLKGLVFMVAGSIGATIVLSVQLAVVEPWLADALRVRALGYATPSAPIELFAIMLGFALVQLAMLWLMSRIVFHRGWLTIPDLPRWDGPSREISPMPMALVQNVPASMLRAERTSNSIETSIRREERTSNDRLLRGPTTRPPEGLVQERLVSGEPPRLGSSYRRPLSRGSRSSAQRDNRS